MKYIYRLIYPLLWLYWFVRRPANFGAAVILEQRGSILLVRHTYGHRHLWYLPGGGRKHGEDLQTTAERELFEEVGVRTPLELLGTATAQEDHLQVHGTFYVGRTTETKIAQDYTEIEETRWWPIAALPAALSPITRAALNLYQDHRAKLDH